MAGERVPPSGPPMRDPTAPARLLDAAAEIGLRVERAQRDLDGLSNAVEHLALAAAAPRSAQRWPAPQYPASGESPDVEPNDASLLASARALAIDLAVGGAARKSIRQQLGRCFGLNDRDPVLTAIMGRTPAPPTADKSKRPRQQGPPDDQPPTTH